MIKKLLLMIAVASSSLSFGQNISAGKHHSLFLCSDATVKVSGNNEQGQLGLGNKTNKTLPEKIPSLNGITAILSGGYHSLFLKNDGTVWATGYNYEGQLGNGNTSDVSTPVQVSGLTGITAISCGAMHSLFLKNDGTVWATGLNTYGQLGNGSTSNASTPVQVIGLTGITAISGGEVHSLFLKNDGTVWATGYNYSGQLGNGSTSNVSTPVQVSGLTGVTAISCGTQHSLFLKNNGTVWVTGTNSHGQLGIGNINNVTTPVQVIGVTGITAISGGDIHSLFLKNDGTVWGTGSNYFKELGLGNINSVSAPVQVSGLTGITAISGGYHYSLFLKNDGTVWATGNNYSGQLGNGNTSNVSTPVNIGNVCLPPAPPQATISVPNNAVCQGSNVNVGATIVGSNPALNIILDNSISLNNPIAIDKNSTGVFVLNNNNSITKYNFNGTVANNYPNLALTSIWAFTVDENDNLYINNGSVDGSGYLQIHKCDNTGTLIESIPNGFMNASNLVTDLLYYNQPGSLENLFFCDTLDGLHAINNMNMNDNNAFTNSGAIYIYNRKYTSLSMDNFYGDKRLLMADPINHILSSTQMFNNGTSIEDTLIDPALTAGMALDYIYSDTTLSSDLSSVASSILVSSRTTGIIGAADSHRNPDGTDFTSIDTTYTSYFNAVAPVGAVMVKNNNQLEFWVADNGQNKLLRLSLSSYNITPTLPAGLIFNSVTGVIEGTPTTPVLSQTYTLTIYGLSGYTSTSTFTLGVTPSSGVSNTIGTANSSTTQNDGTTKNYIDQQNCTQLVVLTDFVGGTSPGYTRVEQTVDASGSVSVGNSNFVRRVTKIEAEQTENINAEIKFFYTYQDVQAFNTAHPADALSNDTNIVTNPARTMITTMLHMHETFDTTNSVWRNVPTFYQNMFATWKPSQQVWELNVPVTKFSEFYLGNPNVATGFNCSNSGKDTIVANDFYVWNYPDSLFASGDYIDTLINHTGCDSIIQLHLTINITTGLNEAALSSGISIFPNPSNGVFNIRFNNATIMPAKARVINVIGTEVLTKSITSSDSIDLSPFQSGIYYLMLESEGTTKTWRIVKQ